MYKSELHNSKETKEILKNGSPDVFFRWYYKKKEEPDPGGKTVKKPTLSQRMDKLDGRIDRIEESITNLARIVEDGFKRVNARIDNLETRIDNLEKDLNARLDYIVKANNLKDSK